MPKIVNMTEAEFFKSKVIVDENDCWVWQGQIDRYGYGHFKWNKTRGLAHRASLRIFKQECDCSIVRHKCKNRACVNPDHLVPGDAQMNALDRVADWNEFREAHPELAREYEEIVNKVRQTYYMWTKEVPS